MVLTSVRRMRRMSYLVLHFVVNLLVLGNAAAKPFPLYWEVSFLCTISFLFTPSRTGGFVMLKRQKKQRVFLVILSAFLQSLNMFCKQNFYLFADALQLLGANTKQSHNETMRI